jgi:ceramide glucosyltransferase
MVTLGDILSTGLLAAAAVGTVLAAIQVLVLRRHLGRAVPVAQARPPISILKPLCGLDDELAENLATFAALPYGAYEVVLGVASDTDPAYAVAVSAVQRWPERFRLVIQRGAPGLNPKVNQLMGLAATARFGILVISDSNTRVPSGYLDEIAALLADPTVGLVTHPIAGCGDERPGSSLGARLDNLHLTGTITPGFAAARVLCGKSYVVGKSMALRRHDLERLGGFGVVKDVLAEDFVLGRLVPSALGKRVVLARSVVQSISVQRTVAAFTHRFARWSVMQRQCAGLSAYLGLLLLNPVLLATLALVLAPSSRAVAALALCVGARALGDSVAGRLLRGRAFAARCLLLVPLKDLIAAAAWSYGLCRRSIEWRSNHLVVSRGSALSVAPPGAFGVVVDRLLDALVIGHESGSSG